MRADWFSSRKVAVKDEIVGGLRCDGFKRPFATLDYKTDAAAFLSAKSGFFLMPVVVATLCGMGWRPSFRP